MATPVNVLASVIGRGSKRSAPLPLSMDAWMNMFSFGGLSYQLGLQQTLLGGREEISGDFESLVRGAYKSCGIVFAAELARMSLFSEARFQFQRLRDGRPGDLFGNKSLKLLEQPYPGGTSGDLLTRMILDADVGGNAYHVLRPGPKLKRLRPDWVTIILGSENDPDVDGWDVDAEILGYIYHPGGRYSDRKPVPFLAHQVSHFAPIPDPEASYRGMSWMTPVILEIIGDKAATQHKIQFFENGATPNLAVKLDIAEPDKFKAWQELFEEKYEGIGNAYKTLFMGAGAEYTVIGADLKQIDFKVTQGAGETRIASASGVPAVYLGISEGLQGSSLNAGNYAMARRRFADGTMRPLWRQAAASLSRFVDVPGDARLWYDDRDISFLQEDVQDAATILQAKSAAIRQLVDAGYKPDSVVDAIESGDLSRLEHTNLFSVQLQPPGTTLTPAAPAPAPAES